MNDCDELALIAFNSSAKIVLAPTKMTLAGKKLAIKKL